MSEPAASNSQIGTNVADAFIQRWGDMGAAWGINRTMAEIQGLLYVTGETLTADDIMARLGISRGNVSMSLRALLDWGVITKEHRRGERRDYFASLTDVWRSSRESPATQKRNRSITWRLRMPRSVSRRTCRRARCRNRSRPIGTNA